MVVTVLQLTMRSRVGGLMLTVLLPDAAELSDYWLRCKQHQLCMCRSKMKRTYV